MLSTLKILDYLLLMCNYFLKAIQSYENFKNLTKKVLCIWTLAFCNCKGLIAARYHKMAVTVGYDSSSKWTSKRNERKSKKFNLINERETEEQERKRLKSLDQFTLFLQTTR
jgi:hypothetical protein